LARKRIKRARRPEGEWRDILSRLENSGLSARAFCQEEGLCQGTLRRWRQKLALNSPARFIELAPTVVPEEPSRWECELALPNGARLRFRG